MKAQVADVASDEIDAEAMPSIVPVLIGVPQPRPRHQPAAFAVLVYFDAAHDGGGHQMVVAEGAQAASEVFRAMMIWLMSAAVAAGR